MRITLTQLLMCVIGVSVTLAYDTRAQEVLNRTVSLVGDQVELRAVLTQIEKQADVKFVYSTKVNSDQRITINLKNRKLSTVLDEVLIPNLIDYEVISNRILLRKIKSPSRNAPNENKTDAIEKKESATSVKGQVTDEKKQPIVGASIVIKGTTRGTVTNEDGRYSIDVPGDQAILVFSYIGFITQEVKVGNQSDISISLAADTKSLDEVVVVGYGQQSKVSLTNAVGTVKGTELVRRPYSSIQQSLQGQVAGLTVLDQGGSPGRTTSTLRVRGVTTLSNSNEALVIVDGIEQQLTNLNPNDIESISVLKDAASTAIYGSRAANGVIMITTKRAKEGKVTVSYNGFYGLQRSVNNPEMDLPSYMKLEQVAYNNAKIPLPAKFTDVGIQEYLNGNKTNPELYPDVNSWFKTMLGVAPQYNNSLSVSGGSESIRARLSIRQQKQASLLDVPLNYGADLRDIRLNTDFKVSNKINVSTDINYRNSYTVAPVNESEVFNRFIHGTLFATPRYFSTLEGTYPGITGTYGLSAQGVTPRIEAEQDGTSKRIEESIFSSLKADYEIVKGLRFTSQLALRIENLRQKNFTNAYKNVDLVKNVTRNIINNALTDTLKNATEYTWNNYLNYETSLQKHYLKALAGYSTINNVFKGLYAYRQNFYNNDIQALSQGANDGTKNNGGSDAQFGLRSYFGRVNYSFADKYLFEANARYDGSSRFTGANVYSFFPSFSAGWRISEESFMKKAGFVNELKLRVSWGQTGNQSVGLYSYYQSLVASSYGFNGATAISYSPTQLANKNITWETTAQVDFGFDAQLFRGFSVGFDYYNKLTDGILLNLPIPATVGLAAPPQNAGKVENKGFELQLGYRNVGAKNVRYSATLNLSANKNTVVSLAGTGPYISGSDIDPLFIIKEGSPINSLWGYKTDGFFKTDDEAKRYPTITTGRAAGDVKYLDLNNDGKIDANDRTIIGSSFPKLLYSLNGNIGFKNFELSLFFQGAAGVDARLAGALAENGNNEGFVPKLVSTNYWTPDNPNARFPRPLKRDLFNMYTADRLVINGDYLRLKNVQLMYHLPTRIVQKMKLESASVYLSATNLLTFSKLNEWGLDAEAGSGRATYYPQVSVTSFGLNIQF
ncbi:TonB-dependent receptor [Spirosoma aureum]|uniref:TonB-dependent receptor n=1 Tax=Spirosoma aureum TaxID=2692134 RepID=A0A6G9AJ05_9BACT|nr:TonB-dependent receptor [Spirosoma aureum]QIP12428.1 TonB-dependent receptor [Spirosoma aureum]